MLRVSRLAARSALRWHAAQSAPCVRRRAAPLSRHLASGALFPFGGDGDGDREHDDGDPRTLFKQRVIAGARSRATTNQGAERAFDVFLFDQAGNYERDRVRLGSLMRTSRLHARDLLLMDRGYRHRQSAILPREGCVLISLQNVKAMVYKDHMLLFDADRHSVAVFADSFKIYLQSEQEKELPFELRVFEGILNHVCERHYRRLCLFGPVISALLKQLTDEDDSEAILRRLLAVKNSLSSFEVNSAEYRTALNELLNSDEDMLAMQLTLLSKLHPGQTLPPSHHEEIELMIESYLRQMAEMFQDAFYLRKSIESTQEIMNINLSSMRNRMIRINLHMAMAGLGLTFGAMTASTFGMNLTSGLESHPLAFWAVTGLIVCISPSIYWACYQYSKGTHRARRRIQDIQAVQGLLRNIEDIEHVLMNHAACSEGVGREKMKELLSLASNREVSDDEVKLIFRIFDVNNHGKLSFSTYINAINRTEGIRE